MPVVLGHALSRKAIHGGTATNDTMDARNIAVLLRGGLLPQASGSPAERRATRDRRRRRMPLARTRGARLAHGHQTKSPSTLPAIGTQIASHTTRAGVAERCAAPAVPKRRAGARARITSDDALRRTVERTIVTTAQHQDAPTLYRRHTVPGIGQLRRLVRLDAIQPLARCPRGQDGASACRLGKGAKDAAGKRSGTSGTTIGPAPLTWAFSDAAVFCLRAHPAGQQCRTRWEKNHRTGKAWTM